MARSIVLKLGKKGGTPKITYHYLMQAINFRACALSFTLACQGYRGGYIWLYLAERKDFGMETDIVLYGSMVY
jgi:hypothetical protein